MTDRMQNLAIWTLVLMLAVQVVPRFFARTAWATDATIDPGLSTSTTRNRTTSSSVGSSWRATKPSPLPVTARRGAHVSPAERGRSTNSSVWTFTNRAHASGRSR